MVFPGQNLPLPCRRFPFDLSFHALPTWLPDCHLVRTVAPCLPIYDSLGDFHCRTNLILASFARMISRSTITERYGRSNRCLSSFPTYSLKAGYTARSTRFCAPPCRFIPDSYAKRLPQNGSSHFRRTSFKSPRKPGRMLHAIGARPGSLTPSIHPKLGVKSRHQGLHRCALHRIFRPYLEEAVLTRILRRQNVYYHIIYEYSRGILYIERNI